MKAPDRNHRLFICLTLLTAVGLAFLHLYDLGSHPSSVFIDEASIGFNAWSIASTGADEYGISYPVFFRCFGNYHDPVMVYTVAPLTMLLGTDAFTVRLPSALYCLLACIGFAMLTSAYLRNRWYALLAGALLGVVPWLFPLSRTTMAGYTPYIGALSMGIYCLLRAFRRRSYRWAAAAGVCCSLAMYAHNVGRPMTALTLILFVLVYNRALLRRYRIGLAFSAVYVGASVPMIISVLRSGTALTARFGTLAMWRDDPTALVFGKRLLIRYLDYFNPWYLFFRGDLNLRHCTDWGGILFLSLLLPIAWGIVWILRHGLRHVRYRFLLCAFLTYPAAAILTMDRMHATRSVGGVLFFCLIAIIGIRAMRSCGPLVHRLSTAILILLLAEACLYHVDYFTSYRVRSRSAFSYELATAIQRAIEVRSSDELIYISGSALSGPSDREFKPYDYALLLFYGRVHPHDYQRKGMRGASIFRPYGGRMPTGGILIISNSVLRLRGEQEIIVHPNPETPPPESTLLEQIEMPEETLAYRLRDKTRRPTITYRGQYKRVMISVYRVPPQAD